ncbi:ABC transporter permease [Ulvibacterium sp.]|uniref:ABC transporter permease n=1 Tax=Ulvibacterium sp. TaxID=2665914 RepID=UPI003BACFEE3
MHNIKLFLRNIKRQKGSFFINIIGLSTGLACVLLIYLWVHDELNMDKFHENDELLYRTLEHTRYNEDVITWKETSGPVAEVLKDEMPEVVYSTAVAPPEWFGKQNLSTEGKDIKALGQYVGKDYFNIFSYGLVHGGRNQVLADKNSIVISESLAMSLFDSTENSIGKVIELEHEQPLQVSGVFKDTPANSTFQFDFAATYDLLSDMPAYSWVQNWGSTGPQVFMVLKKGTDVKQFKRKIADLIKVRQEGSTRTLSAVPYSDYYLYGNYENGKQAGGRIEYVRMFSIIAIIILMIACINFMNLSTAKASKRLKEIGVKKAVGASRRSLVLQHLGESVMMAFTALLVALVMVLASLPWFNNIIGRELTVNFTPGLVLIVLGITLFAGLVAGSYPALYLSGFNAVTIFRGKIKSPVGEFLTRKGLVVVQFALSVVLIVSVLVVYKQIEFIQNKNLGYDKDNVVHFGIEGRVKNGLETFVSEIKKIPGVVNVSSTSHDMIGHSFSAGIGWEGKDPEDDTQFQIAQVNYDLIETLGMEVTSGRSFSRDYSTDSSGIIFNETAIKAMGLDNPIGKKVDFLGQERRIIGTVKDFHFKSLHERVEPMLLVFSPDYVRRIMLRIESGKERETLSALQSFYREYNPGFPLEYQFLDQEYNTLYASEQRVATLSKYFAGLAVLISCLGLFGLAAYTAERRRKEISIRKVLGQTATQVTVMLSGEFAKLVLIAILIALPVAYLLTDNWLSGFAYRIPMRLWYFLAAGLVAFFIALATVSSQALSAANKNPVDGLQEE